MGATKRPSRSKPKKTARHWRFVAAQADHRQGRTLQRCTGYEPWYARVWVELHGARLSGDWVPTSQSLEFPFDGLFRLPVWVGGVEMAYRTVRGEYKLVEHHQYPTVVRDDGLAVPLDELPDDYPALTL